MQPSQKISLPEKSKRRVNSFYSLIMDLKAKNEIIQDIFESTNDELKRWTDQLLTGQIVGIDGKLIMEQAVNHLNQRN